MRKMRYLILSIILFMAAGSFINPKTGTAASAVIEISSDGTEVKVGDKVYIYITLRSDVSFGDFEGNLIYDDEILEYRGGASFVTGSSGFLKLSDVNVPEGDKSRKYTLEFEAIKVGTCDIEFVSYMLYEYESEADMSVSSNVYTLNIKAKETASDNAYLKSLKISPSELSPAFSRDTFVYSTSVDHQTEKLVVEALREDEKSTIKIIGNDSLKEGENKIVITVIAESGSVIEYTINAFKESAPAEEVGGEEPVITPSKRHGTFEVAEIDGELFAVYSGRYKLVEPASGIRIPAGYKKTSIIISDVSVPVYAPENNMDYKYLLIYAENELGEAGFYMYDRAERTLQRYGAEILYAPGKGSDSASEDVMSSEEYKANMNKAAILIALLSVLCVLLAAGLVHLLMKYRGYTGNKSNKRRKGNRNH